MIKYYLLLAILATSFAIADDIYQYTDSNNNIIISNKKTPNANKMELPPLTVYASPTTKKDIQGGNTISNNSGRSNKRQQVLNEELNREKLALSNTQILLEQAKKLQLSKNSKEQQLAKEQINTLSDAINEHNKNIGILTKQLGN